MITGNYEYDERHGVIYKATILVNGYTFHSESYYTKDDAKIVADGIYEAFLEQELVSVRGVKDAFAILKDPSFNEKQLNNEIAHLEEDALNIRNKAHDMMERVDGMRKEAYDLDRKAGKLRKKLQL